ncbi:addiction module toxin RelE [Candidatus Woesearchaeota archaeon CG07_land_8_20_14_0_80_44_23]|nr:MAG: addiction module toxin RelE [Candidatus Woesearchaeota archaeon CG07_land_8_20_14_0_80_44_23]
MRKFSIEDGLKAKLIRLCKRDKVTYDALMGKIDEILNCEDVNHYKNLRKPLQDLKRVHIKGPFVLLFKYLESENKVVFYDFDHHDRIYRSAQDSTE